MPGTSSGLGDNRAARPARSIPPASVALESVRVVSSSGASENASLPVRAKMCHNIMSIATCLILVASGIGVGIWAAMEGDASR